MNILNGEFFEKAKKQYPDNFTLAFTPEAFILGVQLGEEGKAYALTPAHAKRLVAHMTHAIGNYESEHGEIKGGEWSENITSPVQIDSGKGK